MFDLRDDVFVSCIDFSVVPETPPTCNDGEVRLHSNSSDSYIDGGTYLMEISGNVEICFNGTFLGLCSSGNYSFQQTAELVCSSLGYTSELLNTTNEKFWQSNLNIIICLKVRFCEIL